MSPKKGQKQDRSIGDRGRQMDRQIAVRMPLAMASAVFFGLLPSPLFAADFPLMPSTPDLIVATAVLAACALAIAGGLWGMSEHWATRRLRQNLRSTAAKAHALLSARDAWLAGGRESLMVWGADMDTPLSFGDGAALMEACLTGADAPALSAALDALASNGSAFSLSARTADGRRIAVRGCPAGGSAVVYLEPETQSNMADLPDLQAALDALPLPVWLRRAPDLSLGFVNRAFLMQSGATTPEAALAANTAFDRSERDLATAAASDSETVEAKRFAVISGRRRALHFSLSPLPGGSVVGSALDVTALSEAEAKLQQHTDAHAETLDKLATAVAIFGPDKKLSFYNRAYVRLWGLSETWLDTHPAKGEILERLREMRRLPEQPDFRAWKQERLKQFEHPDQQPEELWHLPGGKTLRVVMQPHPFGGMVFLYEDVSDQIRLESSYNTLIKVQKATLDTLQEGVAVFGPDGRLKLYNTAFAQLWRLDTADLAGEPHLKRIADACAARFGRDRAWEIVTSTVTSATPERRREWGEMERSDGAVIAVSIAPLPDGATLASFVDATDRFRIESALRERNEALEASDKLKTEFVKRVSYELRTPLNSILGFAELLKAETPGPLNTKQADYIDVIVKSSNGLRKLINDVLDLSEIEAGTMALDLQKLDLYELLEGLIDQTREWTQRTGLTLSLECAKDAGFFVGDARRLKQVAFNLLSNAFKYTPRGGSVTLGGEIDGDAVRISVADTGPGVSPDVMPSAFERFSAKGVALARAGAGLGLALVNRFVELHHGWVELESVPGKGTKVTCHLPRDAAAKAEAPSAQARA
jgi:signal transduction histidine kinase